jgi:hypothetical protein
MISPNSDASSGQTPNRSAKEPAHATDELFHRMAWKGLE